MKNKRYIFVLLSAAFVAQAVSAGYGEDYDAAIDSIVCNNRALAARRAALEGDRLSLAAENNLSDPDVEFEHQWGQGHIGNKWSVSVSQSFDWPGLYKRRTEVARNGADACKGPASRTTGRAFTNAGLKSLATVPTLFDSFMKPKRPI